MIPSPGNDVFIHETAVVDQPCRIGPKTKIWHFCHIMAGAEIGEGCSLGQNVFLAGTVRIGNNVKIQNNVSLYDGVTLEDDVFCGPSMVFTNIKTPRSAIVRKNQYQRTHVERGATLGANCTVVCGVRIGHHAFIGAGAVVTADVPAYALMLGVPARRQSWVGHAGLVLQPGGSPGIWVCPETGEQYREEGGQLSPLVGNQPGRSEQTASSSVPMLDLQAQFRTIEPAVREAVDRVLKSQHFILGHEVEAFEKEIAAYTGARFAIGCASGSDALLLALLALSLEPGDEILTVPYTFFATVGAVWRLRLEAVFADIDPTTCNMNVTDLERLITPRTRAILPVHLFGQCAEMGPIMELANRRQLFVIEDAAQALGSRYRGQMAGTIGHLGCYSFFPSKNLGGCGDGGMVVTNDPSLADRLRVLRVHGARKKYHHAFVGINSRLDALQAAILRVKLTHLDAWALARRDRAARYRRLFTANLPGGQVIDAAQWDRSPIRGTAVVLPMEAPDCSHVFNQFVIRVDARLRNALRSHLQGRGISSEVYYPQSMHLQTCAAGLGYECGQFPKAERASAETVALPIYPELPDAHQDAVVQAIAGFLRQAEQEGTSVRRAG